MYVMVRLLTVLSLSKPHKLVQCIVNFFLYPAFSTDLFAYEYGNAGFIQGAYKFKNEFLICAFSAPESQSSNKSWGRNKPPRMR